MVSCATTRENRSTEDHSDKPALILVYFFSGYYDYITPITLSKELLEKLEGPEKKFILFIIKPSRHYWKKTNL